MSTHHLDIDKLLRDIDTKRGYDTDYEISHRQVGHLIGVRSSIFTRLARGHRPDADSLMSLLAWIDPDAKISDYCIEGERPGAREAKSRKVPA